VLAVPALPLRELERTGTRDPGRYPPGFRLRSRCGGGFTRDAGGVPRLTLRCRRSGGSDRL